jgi:hypothetical protein
LTVLPYRFPPVAAWIPDLFPVYSLFLILAVGVILTFTGCIGLAVLLDRRRTIFLAFLSFIAPWLVLAFGYPIAGINVHGPATLTEISILPATLLAAALLVMAALKHPPKADGAIKSPRLL